MSRSLTRAVLFALTCAIGCSAANSVWIDTDPSVARGGHEIDDGLARIQAFRAPELSVRGISVVFGNAPLSAAFPIGQRLVQDFGPQNLHVYRGASSAEELGKETDASRALVQALTHEQLTILAIGPATNIATVLENHPELSRQVKQIIAVAGRRPGQRFSASPAASPFRDFNFEMDPQAFRVLLNSRVPLVLVPWEISSKVWLRNTDLETIRASNESLRWVVDAASDWIAHWKKEYGVDGFNPFDTLAIGYARAPSSFSCESLPVAIQVHRDDTARGTASPTQKPYLIASRTLNTHRFALYCSQAPTGFASQLVKVLSGSAWRVNITSAGLDHSRWNNLLTRHVSLESRVNYNDLKHHGLSELNSYLQQLAKPWPDGMDQNATKAALINAYNALTVRWIVSNYPTPSIWSTDHPFRAVRQTIDGRKVSLDQIEEQLRSMQDPRVHSALVCAARSCPPLRQEAYLGVSINEQLDDNVRRWLADPNLNEFSPERHSARVSEIFKWYGGDFNKTGGVRAFLAEYTPRDAQSFLHDPKTAMEYKPYHWGLNDSSELGKGYSQLHFYWDWARNGYLYRSVRNWFFGLGQKYGVNPLIFGGIYVGAIPFFSLSIAWLIHNLRRHKSPVLPLMCASFCFVSAYLYLLIAGKHIPYWVYGFVALMIGFGIYSTSRKIRSKLRDDGSSVK
ncbi:MAG: nucleoside hydrolase [Bryobacteraceae bacterium]